MNINKNGIKRIVDVQVKQHQVHHGKGLSHQFETKHPTLLIYAHYENEP